MGSFLRMSDSCEGCCYAMGSISSCKYPWRNFQTLGSISLRRLYPLSASDTSTRPAARRGLSRTRTRPQLPPAMSVQQARNGAGSNWLFHHRLKSPLNLGCRRHLSSGCAGHERLEQGAFLRERELLVVTSASPRGLAGSS